MILVVPFQSVGIVLFIYQGKCHQHGVVNRVFAIFFGVLLILLAFRLRKLGRESQPMN